jgi:hypothetical protein
LRIDLIKKNLPQAMVLSLDNIDHLIPPHEKKQMDLENKENVNEEDIVQARVRRKEREKKRIEADAESE